MFYLNLQGDAGLAMGVHGAHHASCFMFACLSSLEHIYLHRDWRMRREEEENRR